jgi:hypothetical protein
MIRITVVAGKETFIYDYEGERELTVGRLESNDLPIAHGDVSRTHFSIVPFEGAFKVRDHASRNGVRVNGRIVAESVLAPGDEITIAPEVKVYFGGEPPRRAAAAAEKPPETAGPPPAGEKPPAGEAREEPRPKQEARPAVAPAAEEKPAPRPAVRRMARRPAQQVQSAATLAGIFVFLGGIAYGAWVFLGPGPASRSGSDRADERLTERTGAPLPALDLSGRGSRTSAPSAPAPARRDGADAREWERVQALDLKGELLVAALDEFATKYPTSPHAAEARRRADALRRVEAGGKATDPGAASPALEAEILSLTRGGSFAEALYLAMVGPRLGAADEAAALRLKKQVEKAAYDRFAEARERGRGLVKEGRAFDAYVFVAQVGMPLRRFAFWPEVEAELTGLERSVARQLESGPRGPAVATTGDRSAFDRLNAEARRAIVSCDFDTALDRYRQILALPLGEDEKIAYTWKVYDARRTREIWKQLLERIAAAPDGKTPPLTVTVTQSIKGEVIGGDASGVKIRALIPGEKERPLIEKKWKDLPPVQILEMFRGLDLDGDGLLAYAAYCFEAEYDLEAHGALVKIFEQWPAFRAEAAMLLRRRTGVDAGPADLCTFEGRLVSQAERDRILAQRAEAKAEAKRLADELAAAKREEKGKYFFDKAVALLDAGSFVEGRSLLADIARKFKDAEIGKQARARWEDPYLRRRTIRKSGRDENRVSIDFLAEGYTCEKNEEQQAFDLTADRTMKILDKMEPWNEYAGYFNYYAMNLWSVDRGVSREPGGVKKNTPCGGVVNGGTFTVNNGLARGFVERFAGPSQAVCIGNDNASVATGGGGVVAVVKGMIDVSGHELGHAFGGLLDEYDFDPGGKPAPKKAEGPIETKVLGPNVIEGNQKDDMRAKAPWAHWFPLSGPANWTGKVVDLFEGAATQPKDRWRPQADCRMRTSSSPFCCVCMEQMILRLYGSVRPIDEVDPKDEKIEVTASDKPEFKIVTLRPRSRPLDVKWEIVDVSESENPDGTTTVRGTKAQRLEGKDTDLPSTDPALPPRHLYGTKIFDPKPGLWEVRVTVSDPTVWVQQKDRSALEETHVWRMRVRDNK